MIDKFILTLKGVVILEKRSNKTIHYLNGKLHREDGPAIEYANGRKDWFLHGKRHREDGPAILSRTTEEWYKQGRLHRDNGPAVILSCGCQEKWTNGNFVEKIKSCC